MKLMKELAQPGHLSDSIHHSPILSLSADLETVFWRLDDQETRLSPRNAA